MASGIASVTSIMRLSARVIAAELIDSPLRNEMVELYARYYANVSEKRFAKDLESKTRVLLLNDSQGELQGFTTLAVKELDIAGKPIRYIYSGDTVIHHHFWGEQTLPLAWCELAGRIKAEAPSLPLYWFLIVKGHRTYRYLKVFSRCYFPAAGVATPEHEQNLMDTLATQHFGGDYNAETGVIHFPEKRDHLRQEWMALDEGKRQKPDVAFFLQRNPGHMQGDELVCLTELHADNLRRFALSAFRRGLSMAQS